MLNREKARIVLATPAPISHRTAEECLGIGYLAAALRADGYMVTVIDGWLEGISPLELANRILGGDTITWVGFSCYRSNMKMAEETVAHLRGRMSDLPIVCGGYGPTFFPEHFIRAGFDVVVRGEGERAICDLARHFAEGAPLLPDIPGITFSEQDKIRDTGPPSQEIDLDSLPVPARDTLRLTMARKSAVHLSTSRGCMAHCLFCSVVAFAQLHHGTKWRQRSVASIVDEIELLSEKGVRYFKVIDDSFIEPPRDEAWCARLADELGRRSLEVRLRGSIRADRVTRGVLRELKRAGFFSFSCGIESFSPTALRRMAKSASACDNQRALDLFGEFGFLVQAGHILFDPDTTIVELRENLEGMRRYSWTVSKGVFTEMFAAEGTPFTRLLRKRGRLDDDEAELENRQYTVADPDARGIYRALKIWHVEHMALYDRAIDAISAPKAIDAASVARFSRISNRLRYRDLTILEGLLDRVDSGQTQVELLSYVREEIERSRTWYSLMEKEVDRAYVASGLIYDGDLNPFIA